MKSDKTDIEIVGVGNLAIGFIFHFPYFVLAFACALTASFIWLGIFSASWLPRPQMPYTEYLRLEFKARRVSSANILINHNDPNIMILTSWSAILVHHNDPFCKIRVRRLVST